MPSTAALAEFDDPLVADAAGTPARFALRLEAASTLNDSDRAALDALIQSAGDNRSGNVFFEPRAVLASGALSKQPIQWLLWSDETGLNFAAPVTIQKISGFSFLKIWTHTYAPLGTPLVSKSFQPEPFFDALAQMGFVALVCPWLEKESVLAKAASQRTAHSRGFWSAVAERAVLTSDWAQDAALSKQRKKKLRKMQRQVPLVHTVLRGRAAETDGFRQFCDLEAMGWKGAAGSALKQSEPALSFATELVAGHAARGTLAIDSLDDPTRDGDQAVAMVVSFEQAGRGVVWKIGHNTDYDAVSPGYQVILAASRRLAGEAAQTDIDSLAGPDHPLVGWLWPERLTVGTLVIPLAGSNLPAHILSGFFDAESRLRALARSMRQRLRG